MIRGPLTPFDLDASSLAWILSFLNWRAISRDEYVLLTEVEPETPRTITPKKKRKPPGTRKANRGCDADSERT